MIHRRVAWHTPLFVRVNFWIESPTNKITFKCEKGNKRVNEGWVCAWGDGLVAGGLEQTKLYLRQNALLSVIDFILAFKMFSALPTPKKTAQNSVRMHRWVSLISNFWCPCFWKLLRSSKFKIIVMHLWVCLLSLISLRSANFNNRVLDLIFHSAVLFPEKKFKGRTPTSSFFYYIFFISSELYFTHATPLIQTCF